MNASTMTCRQARFEMNAEPNAVSPALAVHLEGCAACTKFRAETLALDARLSVALEIPLSEFRHAPSRARPFALAASVILGLVVAGMAWTLRPAPALAGELIQHVGHESESWTQTRTVPAAELAAVLAQAGVEFDARFPVIYASACPFKGRVIPHLVITTAQGPMTVMLLEHETVDKSTEFSEGGYHGVLLPAGSGSVAVLARDAQVDPQAVSAEVVSAIRW